MHLSLYWQEAWLTQYLTIKCFFFTDGRAWSLALQSIVNTAAGAQSLECQDLEPLWVAPIPNIIILKAREMQILRYLLPNL